MNVARRIIDQEHIYRHAQLTPLQPYDMYLHMYEFVPNFFCWSNSRFFPSKSPEAG
jgi:hypothetical protein